MDSQPVQDTILDVFMVQTFRWEVKGTCRASLFRGAAALVLLLQDVQLLRL